MTKRQLVRDETGCVECREGRDGHYCATCARQVDHGTDQCAWCITAGKPEPDWRARGGK